MSDVVKAVRAAERRVMQYSDIHQRYDVKYDREISRNGDSVVRKCIDRETGERLYVKSTDKLGQQSIDALRNEAVLLAGFEHPNILGVREVFEDDKYLHIVTERCKGGELFDRLVNKGRKGKFFSEVEAAAVVYQLLLAVSYLHRKAVVHRDIKLEGIALKSRNKGYMTLRICNFDVATGYNPETSPPMNERVGSTFSTAPEVLRGLSYTNKCDVWAVGVIGYALMCGKAPFQARHALDTLELVKSDRVVEFPVPDWGGVSERGKNFLRLCLSKNPSSRPTPDQLLGHSWIQCLKPYFLNVIDAPPPTKRRILGKGFLSRRSRFNRTSGRITMTGSVNVIRHEIV